jgi:predicted Fe-Mo cluster-binding NifX family protein
MKLCMPTVDEAGLAGRMAGHFGSAPYFTYVDSDSGAVEVVANAHAHHEHGSCAPATGMSGRAVDAVICHGLGRRALAGLAAAGIPVYVTAEESVAGAVEEFRFGGLAVLTEDAACHGGHGHQRHGHAGEGSR